MIVERRTAFSCPWLDVVAKRVDLGPPRGEEVFWSVATPSDYTAVLAVTDDGLVPLVRLFRPALEAYVLELPSGAVDPGEAPDVAARRELLEETGCAADEIVSLGMLFVDSGRMQTRQWGFFAPAARRGAAEPHGDEQLELLFVPPEQLRGLLSGGELRLAPHVAIVCLALAAGHLAL